MKYIVKAEDQGMTLEELVKDRLDISNRLYRKLKKASKIRIEGRVEDRRVLVAGEVVRITFDYEKNTFPGQAGPLEILYEDEDLLVVNKDPFVVVHPTRNILKDTLINHLSEYLYQKQEFCKLRFVSRLDRDTSGAILVAKNSWIHHRLTTPAASEAMVKDYIALVRGRFAASEGLVELPVGPLEDGLRQGVTSRGKPALTGYRVLESCRDYTLLTLRLYTGRTHQIRVHMAHIGHPVAGDTLYDHEDPLFKRQFLHASKIGFIHPVTGEYLDLAAPLKSDLKAVLQQLKEE